MTYAEALQRWREEIIADADTERWSNLDGYRLLFDAAKEVAAALRIPMLHYENPDELIPGSTRLYFAGMFSHGQRPVEVIQDSVRINGVIVEQAPYNTVMRRLGNPPYRYPRYYYYDKSSTGDYLLFSPSLSREVLPGEASFQYVPDFGPNNPENPPESIWLPPGASGIEYYPEWHHLVLYRAAIATFTSLELYERASMFAQLYNQEVQAFAAYLGKTDIANVMVQPDMRNDRGSDIR